MDADRFDTLARSLSVPRSRRAALSSAAAGGLLSALGLTRAVPETRAAQGGLCVVAFAATTGRTGEVRGNLSFSLAGSGNLDNAALTLPDGAQLPVVGQATGHSLQLRIALGPQQAMVAVGVGEQEISRCQGVIDGVATGAQRGISATGMPPPECKMSQAGGRAARERPRARRGRGAPPLRREAPDRRGALRTPAVGPRGVERRAPAQAQRCPRARAGRRIAPMWRSVAICAPRRWTAGHVAPAVRAWSARRGAV